MLPLALWTTPSLQISLAIEAEKSDVFDTLYALLRPSLRSIVAAAPLASSHTLRLVDYELHSASRGLPGRASLSDLAAAAGISPDDDVLSEAYTRVAQSYALTESARKRTEETYGESESVGERLLKVWVALREEEELGTVFNSKKWQELGFQGTNPLTDFRSLGLFALDALEYLAENDTEETRRVVDESVNGGLNWYPFALAVIHVASFVLELAESRALQLVFFRHLQSIGEEEPSHIILDVTSQLVLEFHTYWKNSKATVMDFESTFADFKRLVTPYIERGILDFDVFYRTGSLFSSEGRIKLD